MELSEAKALLQKYREGKCTGEEKELVESWYDTIEGGKETLTDDELLADLAALRGRLQAITAPKQHPLRWVPAVAAILFLTLGLMYYLLQPKQPAATTNANQVIDPATVVPGGNIATLTLTDGRVISLSDAANGVLDSLGGITISKTADGQIVYKAVDASESAIASNTISTPRGGQYQVQLPDGSKVWLNAASTLTYPTSFAKGREVTLSGEAFFDVAHNVALPFVVKTAGQDITVLGTRFNVHAYASEGRTATVLERGSVRVKAGAAEPAVLKPGQQAILNSAGSISIGPADMETALAWQQNEIRFKDATLQEVLQQASRWYNVDVVYKTTPGEELLTGGVSRSASLASLIKILELSGVKCTVRQTVSGKSLIVE